MIIKRIYNYNLKNYVWKKRDFLLFFDDYYLYQSILYIQLKKNINYIYFNKKNNTLLDFDLMQIYKSYRWYYNIK